MQDEPVGITYQDLGHVVSVQSFVLEYVDCPAVFEILAKKTEDSWLAQLGVFQHAPDEHRLLHACPVGLHLEQGVGTGILGHRPRVAISRGPKRVRPCSSGSPWRVLSGRELRALVRRRRSGCVPRGVCRQTSCFSSRSTEPYILLGRRGPEENAIVEPLDGGVDLTFGRRHFLRVMRSNGLAWELPFEALPLLKRTSVN